MLASEMVLAQVSKPVDVNFETKVIYADSLNLPKNINVGALLRLLPELLQRPGDYILSNYEVQVDKVSVGEAADAVLSVMQLADIERLEVKNSPASSDLNGGMSGAINIVLRPVARRGVSGKIAAGTSSESTTMADMLLDYKGEKLTVRGMAFGENTMQSTTKAFTQPMALDLSAKDWYRSQMARAKIAYAPNGSNRLELTLTENYIYDKYAYEFVDDIAHAVNGEQQRRTDRVRKTNLNARLMYVSMLNESHQLKLEGQYGYKPVHGWVCDERNVLLSEDCSYNDVFEGVAELTGKWRMREGKGAWGYKVGAKGAVMTTNKRVQPEGELTFAYGQLRMKAGAEYEWNEVGKSDWTGRFVTEWALDQKSVVRLLLNRQLRQPRMLLQEVGAEYLTNMGWGKHSLTMNAGANYCKSSGLPDVTNYLNTNVMAIYQYGIFFVSVTGNLYTWKLDAEDANEEDYKTYYNMSIMPSLNMRNGWRTAMNVRYYSRVHRHDENLGDCLSLQMNVGKSWGCWTVYAYGRVPLTGRTKDIDKVNNTIALSSLVPASCGGGVSWDF